MQKQISQFKTGDVIAFMENNWNHVVARIIAKDEEGVSLLATSLTFGEQEVDGIFLPANFKVTKWQIPIPEILKD
jgi:hypothetical protein